MQVSATTWSTLSKLLDEAFDLEPPARAVWFEQLSVTQPGLASSVRKLLAAHSSSETADVLARLPKLDSADAPTRISALAAGDRIGPYRLKREIGAGGMADVWLAERADGAFTRDVALKLPLINRLRRDLALRFARERDILARLEHPHIARLYDAGVTDDGLPYLAMEYVDGQPITQYCDEHKLGIEARLKLFAQVLDAVQFAHASLIIHRDIKPSNILVTAGGEARLLDFGIAKLLAGDDTAQETQLTQMSGRALTPDYASPEQIKGESLTIATDIYSLAVVLYELLAGSRPYRVKMQSAAQVEHAIVGADALKPSANRGGEAAARVRGTTPPKLRRALAGDLDTITLKAMSKAPAERYATVVAFAEDLQRHLNGQPVRARPSSVWYATRKFIIRHRWPVTATTTAAVLLLTATLVSIHQRVRAERESVRATATRDFLLDIFRANSFESANPQQAQRTTARELLEIADKRLRESPIADTEVRYDIHNTLMGLYAELDDDERRIDIAKRVVAMAQSDFGAKSAQLAESLVELAVASRTSQPQMAEQALRDADSVLRERHDDHSEARAKYWTSYGYLYMSRAPAVSENAFHAASEIFRARYPSDAEFPEALTGLGMLLSRQGRYEEAEAALREAMRALQTQRSKPDLYLTITQTTLAEALAQQAKYEEAESHFKTAHERARDRLGASHIDSLQTGLRYGWFLRQTGHVQDSIKLLRQQEAVALRTLPANEAFTLPVLRFELGTSLAAAGKHAEAVELFSRAIDVRGAQKPSVVMMAFLSARVRSFAALGEFSKAHEDVAAAQRVIEQLHDGSTKGSMLDFNIAQLHLALAEWDGAKATSLIGELTLPEASPTALVIYRHRLAALAAEAAFVSGHYEEAIENATRAFSIIDGTPFASTLRQSLGQTRIVAAESALQLGRCAQAIEFSTTGRELLAAEPADGPMISLAVAIAAACSPTTSSAERRAQLHAIVSASKTHSTWTPHVAKRFSLIALAEAQRNLTAR